MGYKTTADLLEAQNLFGVEKSQIRQDNATENLSYFLAGSKNRATPPQGTPSAPNAQGVADALRMNQINQSKVSNRPANFDATKSRMALPVNDLGKTGVKSLAIDGKTPQSAKPELSDLDRLKGAYDIDYKYRGLYGNQDIDLSKRKITEVNTLANNEANRAYGMQLATQFPYQKYANESASARSIMDNSQAAIPTFLNRATASRLNPVSMSL